jgi:hypothetical protein
VKNKRNEHKITRRGQIQLKTLDKSE